MNEMEIRRWKAIRGRQIDNAFIYGVRTTRIACRPGCPSRTPRAENVVFFDTFAAAEAAGFRACKRCSPDDDTARAAHVRLVAQACALMDADETLSFEAASAAVGLSRFHFQRIFRAVLGVTPGQYRRARRDERLRTALSEGRSVTEAIHSAGFGSSSRAYEAAALGMTPSAFRRGAAGERIAYAVAGSSLGRVLVARTQRGVCAIELGDEDERNVAALKRTFPHAAFVANEAALAHNLASVIAIIDGRENATTEPKLDMRGTAFQRKVWNALRAIPSGERWSYAQVATALGLPGHARAVAAACAGNHLAVVVPCHRVVAANGDLRGYRWGVARKAELLRREASETRAES